MRDAIRLAFLDFRHLMRRRETLLWAFVLPVVFFYFIGTITAQWGPVKTQDTLAVLVPNDAGFLADHLVRRLERLGYSVVREDAPGAMARYSRRLAIPPGFTKSVLDRKHVELKFSRNGAGADADYDQLRLSRAAYRVIADMIVLAKDNRQPTAAALEQLDATPHGLTLDLRTAGRRRDIPSGFEQAVPGSMVFFLLLVLVASGAATLVVERDQGILRRLASSPMSRGAVVFAKWGARMLLGLIQIAFGMIAGTILFHVHWGAHIAVIVLVLVCYASFAASTGVLFGSFARTRAQAGAFGSVAANVLACIGGCWWPAEIMPPSMQAVSRWTPPGMAMGALHQLINFGSGAASALPQAAMLAGLAIVAGLFAARNFRFM